MERVRHGEGAGRRRARLGLLVFVISGTGWPAGAHPPPERVQRVETRLSIAPNDPAALMERAELRRLLGHWADAELDLATAMAQDPERVEIELCRARLYEESGRPDQAVAAATAFLESPRGRSALQATAFEVRARAYRDLGRPVAALADLDRALAAVSNAPPELFLERADLVRAILTEGEPVPVAAEVATAVLEALDEGIALLGPVPALQGPAIELEVQRGAIQAALQRLESLRAQAAVGDAWLEWRGEILLAADRPREAKAAFAQALRELRRRSPTARSSRVTTARRARVARRLSELEGVGQPPRVAIPLPRSPQRTVAASSISAAEIASAAPSLTRGPYLQLVTETSAVVRWRSEAAADSRVAWGPAPGDLGSEVVDPTPVTDHALAVTGLDPGACYFYSVGTTTDILAGADAGHSFCTAAADAAVVDVWVIGDSGTADANAAAVRDAYLGTFPDQRPDVWLMLGDNAYWSGTDPQYQSAVFDMYPTLLRRTAAWPTLGNHDLFSSSSASQVGPYFDIFSLPTRGEAGGVASGTESYYAFDRGPVHFVSLDSAGFSVPTEAMLEWLRADLVSTDRQWIVVYFHHPPYSQGSHDSDNPADSGGRLFAMRETIVPILESHGVDLVLSGHSHSYERSLLIDGHHGTSDTLDPSMLMDGGDGSPEGDGAYVKRAAPRQGAVYSVVGSSGLLSGGPLNHPVMQVSLNELGSLVLRIEPSGLEGRFIDAGGAQRDRFRIEKIPGLIFAHGFESGDLTGWSASRP